MVIRATIANEMLQTNPKLYFFLKYRPIWHLSRTHAPKQWNIQMLTERKIFHCGII
jgi:hypothetical protein